MKIEKIVISVSNDQAENKLIVFRSSTVKKLYTNSEKIENKKIR
jgi:hypothetical protein